MAWIVLVITGALFFVFPYLAFDNNSAVLLTLGRFHPIFLHFPIVLMLLLLGVEVVNVFIVGGISFRFRFYLFLFAISCTLASIISGYFLYSSGEYGGLLMDQHFDGAMWTGFLLLLSFAAFCFHWSKEKYFFAYLTILIAANGTAFYTAHQGGSITHGKGYLTSYLPAIGESTAIKTDSSQLLYEDVVRLIFDAKCVSCHNTLRAEGHMSLASYDDMFKIGDSGKMPITAGKSSESEILRRVMLPDSVDEHMPTQGKKNLEPNEIEIIKIWIDLGAKKKQKVASIIHSKGKELVENMNSSLLKYSFVSRVKELNAEKLSSELHELAEELEVVIKPDTDGEYYTLSNKFPPVPFNGEKLEKLKPYLDVFNKISLVSSQIDDSDLYLISQMPNLTELYLQKTALTGEGIVVLSHLQKLEVLNISYTKTSDKDLINLTKFPALREVFVYSTSTTNDVIKALGAYKPRLKIYSEEGPYF